MKRDLGWFVWKNFKWISFSNLIALNFVLRCRSAYKLKEIIEEHKIIEEGARVLDLGCAPGSWCQVLFENIFPKSKYDQQIGEGIY